MQTLKSSWAVPKAFCSLWYSVIISGHPTEKRFPRKSEFVWELYYHVSVFRTLFVSFTIYAIPTTTL